MMVSKKKRPGSLGQNTHADVSPAAELVPN